MEQMITVNALISAHGRLDFLCALGWALIRVFHFLEILAPTLAHLTSVAPS